ncbi:MAG: c-type cytochrome [Halioglobus sp.]|nr:c-type cytochrome [Halioglobus sp.]
MADYLTEPVFAAASPELGDRLLMQCAACHRFAKEEGQLLGPNLHGVFGRKAGSLSNFAYTRSFSDVDFVWTPRALDAWLTDPSRFLPGNAMAFAGIPDPDDRAALIAALLRRSGEGPE